MWLLLGCALLSGPTTPTVVRVEPRAAQVADAAWVRYRPGEPLPVLGPDARVDLGLRAAAEELAAQATTPDARFTPGAIRRAVGRAGYPGDTRWVRAVAGAAPPPELLASIPGGQPVDVGWAWRALPDGRRWWVVGWAPRRASLDPVRRDLTVDEGLSVRVDGLADPRLFVGLPEGDVREVSLTPGVARWVDLFHVPGEYRVEVVDGESVELLFSVYVDVPVPPPEPLPGPAPVPDPEAAARWLADALTDLRSRAGLPALPTFSPMVPLVRAHATCIAGLGLALHASPSCPGVPELARRTFFPRARHHQDVAVGDTAPELWERLQESPAHRANLLCRTCSHAIVATALEPAAPPRLFAVWELLEFPEGEPRPIPFAR